MLKKGTKGQLKSSKQNLNQREILKSKLKKDDKGKPELHIKRERALKNVLKNTEHLNDIKLPKKGETLRLISKKIHAFYFVSLIADEIIDDLTIAVYSFSRKAILTISELYAQEKIKHVTILISDTWVKLKHESDYQFIKQTLPYATFGYTRTHTKLTCLKTQKGNHYVYQGSGNFSNNTNDEQYIIDNDLNSYNFYKKWIDEKINQKNDT